MASMEEEAAVICSLSDWTVLSDWLIFRPVEAPTKVTSITLMIWVIATNHGTGSASVRITSCRIQKEQHLTIYLNPTFNYVFAEPSLWR